MFIAIVTVHLSIFTLILKITTWNLFCRLFGYGVILSGVSWLVVTSHCVTFWEVFPKSIKSFDDDFKEGLVDLVFQWISGIANSFLFPEAYFVQTTSCAFQWESVAFVAWCLMCAMSYMYT